MQLICHKCAVDLPCITINAIFPCRANFAAIFQNSYPDIKENKGIQISLGFYVLVMALDDRRVGVQVLVGSRIFSTSFKSALGLSSGGKAARA
jgi:hypothetical protein